MDVPTTGVFATAEVTSSREPEAGRLALDATIAAAVPEPPPPLPMPLPPALKYASCAALRRTLSRSTDSLVYSGAKVDTV